MEPEHNHNNNQLPEIKTLVLLSLQSTFSKNNPPKPCEELIELSLNFLTLHPIPTSLSTFHSLILPQFNPKLSQEIISETGITQSAISKSKSLEHTLENIEKWLKECPKYEIETCCFAGWDIKDIQRLRSEIKMKKLKLPMFLHSYFDLKSIYSYQIGKIEDNHMEDTIKNIGIEVSNNPQENFKSNIQNQSLLALLSSPKSPLHSWNPTRQHLSILQDLVSINVSSELEYLLILDFEATCEDNIKLQPCSEIIEFPVMIVNLKENKIIEEKFHQYVQPTYNPKLTKFCTELTGIKQDMIEGQPNINETLKSFELWLKSISFLHSKNYTFVTCGDWDLSTCLKHECKTKQITVMEELKNYINIKKMFVKCFEGYNKSMGMMGMINSLGIPHEGRHHSGIDDVKNICNICMELVKKDFKFKKEYITFVK